MQGRSAGQICLVLFQSEACLANTGQTLIPIKELKNLCPIAEVELPTGKVSKSKEPEGSLKPLQTDSALL